MVNFTVVVDDKEVQRLVTTIRRRIPVAGDFMTKKAAHSLKRKIINNIPHTSGSQGLGHSTPIPLQKHLHLRKSERGHDVFFSGDDFIGSKGTQSLALERGTRPHAQPNNPFFRVNGHPGARGTRFFSRSVNSFRQSELKGIVKQGADLLVRGLGR